ncbi:hypothetical protein J2777_005915 [Paraburkholderia graminis]|uniref:hypothetical protein n=1 Tax=Paraburkholderia graminis TaxID=60548 RepID=UPI002859DFBC|nr:hypothetical protein [Paraburkholderia graminis]MDR6472174.1 hypothetical protein [Paraburkholderia graminis]
MDREDFLSTGPSLSAADGWHCGSMQALVMLKAERPLASDAIRRSDGPAATPSWRASLSTDVARAFESQTGYATSAIALMGALDETLERVRFLGTGGSSAAVIVLDAKFLSRFWPRCDWMTPLLRTRNRVADEGLKLFVALTTNENASGVVGLLARPREWLVALRTQRYCEREGIGFLGTVQTDERMVGPRNACPPSERVGRTIADRLASRRFFCCDSFRIGAADV